MIQVNKGIYPFESGFITLAQAEGFSPSHAVLDSREQGAF
jgi:hypothetical protein